MPRQFYKFNFGIIIMKSKANEPRKFAMMKKITSQSDSIQVQQEVLQKRREEKKNALKSLKKG